MDICKVYIQTINQGKVPSIESAWEYIWAFEWERQIKILQKLYGKEILDYLSTEKVTQEEAKNKNREIVQKYIQEFNKHKIGEKEDTQKFTDLLQKKFNKIYTEVLMQVKRLQNGKIETYLSKLVYKIDQKVRKGNQYKSVHEYIQELDKENDIFDSEFPIVDSNTRATFWKLKARKLVFL